MDGLNIILQKLKDGRMTLDDVKGWTKIVDGNHVIRSAMVGFTFPGTFFYLVLEAEETFQSRLSTHEEAYYEWKADRPTSTWHLR